MRERERGARHIGGKRERAREIEKERQYSEREKEGSEIYR